MTTQPLNSSRVLMWMAGIAVILFSIAGIGAIMGWIPTSMGHGSDSGEIAVPDKYSGTASKPAGSAVVASSSPRPASCVECGVVESTRAVSVKGEGSGIGAVGGAVVGGLLGNQIGNGRGKTVATVVGAVGGTMAGNEVEKRVKTTTAYEVTVRMNDGSSRVIHQASAPTWRAGDRVRIINGALESIS